jgi:hypothetical protein
MIIYLLTPMIDAKIVKIKIAIILQNILIQFTYIYYILYINTLIRFHIYNI